MALFHSQTQRHMINNTHFKINAKMLKSQSPVYEIYRILAWLRFGLPIPQSRSLIMNFFRKKISLNHCKNRIKLCFHNEYVQYS